MVLNGINCLSKQARIKSLAMFLMFHAYSAAYAGADQYNAKGATGATLLDYQQQAADPSKKLTNTTANLGAMMADMLNLFLMGCTFVGLILVGISVFGIWKASKDERESPKHAPMGIIVGVLMTCITTIAFLVRNNVIG
ncbi:hypothetical protein R6242_18835 [Iodobacter sp. CM08]|uniref:hypothetical protein n=1 Tax=Iodobacter sp. CM08 TaxID=3085902 RepID=UPI0029823935|nr:hypothetical protein [Iodobacter sp. CM08]MDW5418625.1 hypothetical protein [Iodobacter sp. CM08]